LPTDSTAASGSAGSVAATTNAEEASLVGGSVRARWELTSVEALKTLMANADGYAYYYLFDSLPAELVVKDIVLPADMSECDFRLIRPDGKEVLLYVFTANQGMTDVSHFTEVTVDGKQYYYSEEYEGNELTESYFQWIADGRVFLVHPQDKITADVIRKYNQIKKVEVHIGQGHVGFDTGLSLIADPAKIKSVIKGNSEIKYHTGVVPEGQSDDLLRP
jgi:hypothetical protein